MTTKLVAPPVYRATCDGCGLVVDGPTPHPASWQLLDAVLLVGVADALYGQLTKAPRLCVSCQKSVNVFFSPKHNRWVVRKINGRPV